MQHERPSSSSSHKRNDDDEYGIVMVSDIAKQVLRATGRRNAPTSTRSCPSRCCRCDPDMDIRYCARLFDRFGLSRAPVMDNGSIVGIVSYTDMVLRGLYRGI